MDRIAVLIPCFNEASSVAKVVRDFRIALPDVTIYVYDNNSTDGTPEITEKAGAVVKYDPRQGKGNVVRRMFQDINAECYIMADGDDAFPADGFKVIRTILQFLSNYEPFKFFGMLSFFLVILSILFLLPVLADYLRMGLVERFPTLIVCGFAMIAAFNLLFAGIILHSMK